MSLSSLNLQKQILHSLVISLAFLLAFPLFRLAEYGIEITVTGGTGGTGEIQRGSIDIITPEGAQIYLDDTLRIVPLV